MVPRVAAPLLVWIPAFFLGLLLAAPADSGTAFGGGSPEFLVLLLLLYSFLVGTAVKLLIPTQGQEGGHFGQLTAPRTLLRGAALGIALGGVGGAISAAATILPFWAGWGGRELADFGGSDLTWQGLLFLVSALFAFWTAIAGAVAGLVASALALAGFDLTSGTQ